jgi:tripartite ATP-independent transporter DctP family solute receptor
MRERRERTPTSTKKRGNAMVAFWGRSTATLGLLAAIAWIVPPAAAQTRSTAKVSTVVQEGHPLHQGLVRMGELVNQRTGGAVEIRVFPVSQLGGELETAEGMRLGSIEGGTPTLSLFSNWVPEVQLADLPFLFRSDEHAQKAADLMADQLAPKFTPHGFRLVGISVNGARNLISTFPVNGPDDLKGRKMRTMQVPIHIQTWQLLGANPTPIPAPEIYGAMQTKIVDFFDNTPTNYLTFKFNEVGKYFIQLDHMYAFAAWTFSERWISRLPKEHQDAIARSVREVTPSVFQALLKADAEALAKTKETGSTITKVTDKAPWQAKMTPVYDDLMKKVPTAQPLLQEIQKL